jgi:hypothetical protein
MKQPKDSMTNVEEKLALLADRDSFFAFVRAMIEDREAEINKGRIKTSNPYGAGASGWGNGAIETYLDAALGWAEDTQELSREPTWKAFAQFLYSGKIHE